MIYLPWNKVSSIITYKRKNSIFKIDELGSQIHRIMY